MFAAMGGSAVNTWQVPGGVTFPRQVLAEEEVQRMHGMCIIHRRRQV